MVFDHTGSTATISAYFTWLAATLEPEVLLVCAERRGRIREEIGTAVPAMQPSDWHAVESGEEGSWRLRPAALSMQVWCERHLSPPYGFRSWLRQRVHRWRPFAHQIWCLPLLRQGVR